MKILFIFIVILLHPYKTYSACNIVNGKKYGDCSNVTVNIKSYPKSLIISNNQTISGIKKNIKILAGGDLYLTGISQDILIEKYGKLTLTGMANNITNNGGTLLIEGNAENIYANGGNTIIKGVINSIVGNGNVKIENGAVINGKVYE